MFWNICFYITFRYILIKQKGGEDGKKIKEVRLRIFPKNKENVVKIDKFRFKIIINKTHIHFVDGLTKISGKIPAPAGPGYWDVKRILFQQQSCGNIFFPFREFVNFPEWNENEWITIFGCEEIIDSLKWYCKILKLNCEETIQQY